MFCEVASMAEPAVAKQLLQFAERTAELRSLRSGLFEEVETGRGSGFISRDIDSYNPTLDLKHLAVAIASCVGADKYQPDGVSVATKLPSIWLARGKSTGLDQVLGRVRAGATISARLRPTEHPQHEDQNLWVFIVETSEASDVETLLRFSQAKGNAEDYCMIGVVAGRLFALVVARSIRIGVESFETAESLARFRDKLPQILAQYMNRRI
jgi:hypothetical protein